MHTLNLKFTLYQAMKAQRGSSCIPPQRSMGVGGRLHATTSLPTGKSWYSLYRRLGCPQGWSGLDGYGKSPPRGFDTQTIQPVASHYAI
jgi:hypothetical protein